MNVIGDPAGMRELAVALRSKADRTSSIAQRLAGKVDSMRFQGPYATTVRRRLLEWHRGVVRAARELHDLADYVSQSAGQVEEQIMAERRRAELERAERERRARERARDAARR